MGINNLNPLLRKHCPHIYREVRLSEFAFQKIAIDVSLFMCKFKTISDNWVGSFISLITCLRKNDVHCVFIFDTGHPPEKIQERQERVQGREKIKARVDELEISLLKYETTDVFDAVIHEFFLKIEGVIHASCTKEQKITVLREKIEKKKRANFNISPEDWSTLRQLFDIMHVGYYNAPLEAETMCADLCKRGLVSGAMSDDTDVLAYGSPVFLTNINIYKETVVKIEYGDILHGLNLTSEQFLDLCIMCGTDYNKNIPKVGCETSYKYISTYGSIEEVGKQKNLDISILNHQRSRELFTKYDQYVFGEDIMYNGQPDYEKLIALMTSLNLNVNIEQIKKSYIPKIIFEEK
jgi:5'-3' exonuclease